MKRKLLSKSKYLNGLQCQKYLWLLFNDKDKVPQPDASTQHVFDEGHRIGELAKRLFLDGIDIPSDDFIGNLNKTKEELLAYYEKIRTSVTRKADAMRRMGDASISDCLDNIRPVKTFLWNAKGV